MKKFMVEVREDSRIGKYLLAKAVIQLIVEEDDIDVMETEFEVAEVKINYEKMWDELKGHYENRVEKLKDKKYENTMNPRTFAESILDVMEHLELKNETTQNKN